LDTIAGTPKQAGEVATIVVEFTKRFGDQPLAQLTQWQLEKWKTERSKEVKPKPSTYGNKAYEKKGSGLGHDKQQPRLGGETLYS